MNCLWVQTYPLKKTRLKSQDSIIPGGRKNMHINSTFELITQTPIPIQRPITAPDIPYHLKSNKGI